MSNLEFPLLLSDLRPKRSSDQLPAAKRCKTVMPDEYYSYEDNTWMDHFLFLDSETFQTENLAFAVDQALLDQGSDCQNFIKNERIEDSSTDSITNEEWGILRSHLQSVAEDQDKCELFPRVSTPLQLPTSIMSEHPVVSPSYDCGASSIELVQYAAIVEEIPPLPQHLPSVDSGGAFTISALRNSNEPTLLTLTSFPFRITYCNGAFTTLCGNKTSPIGDQIFDVFEVEGRTLKPSLARYPTLDGYFDNEVVLVPFLNEKGQSWRRCKIQVYPVYKRSNPNELRFFAVTFMPL